MTRLVAFIGFKESGKTTAANYLRQEGFVRMRFADPLKDMLRVLGLTDAHIDGHLKETPNNLLRGKTPRRAMQTLGTEWGRDLIGDDIWTNLFRHRAMKFLMRSMTHKIVVDDCRFENELSAILGMGGKVCKIIREGKGSDGHRSEKPLELPLDAWQIDNSGSISDLYRELDKFLKVMG